MFTLNQAICLHMGGVMRVCVCGGGVRVRAASRCSPITRALCREAAGIDWPGGARGPAGSQWGARVKVRRDFNKRK